MAATALPTVRTWTIAPFFEDCPIGSKVLGHLHDQGFLGAPGPIRHTDTVDELEYLPGETVEAQRSWPGWVHNDQALSWRENHSAPGPGVIVVHNDAAPCNAVWAGEQLVGFVGCYMAGLRQRADDLAWTAFSWVPLPARRVVSAEGFTEFDRRRQRLEIFLDACTPAIEAEEVLARLDRMLTEQIELMTTLAEGGDQTYRRLVELGRNADLAEARREIRSWAGITRTSERPSG